MINAIINSIDDTANADVIELSVPDIYKASISKHDIAQPFGTNPVDRQHQRQEHKQKLYG